MAISGGDGSIILQTKVDTSGIKKGTGDIKNAISSTNKGLSALRAEFSKALGTGDIKAAQLTARFQKATQEVENQSVKVVELQERLRALESGEIKVEDKGVSKLQSDFEKATVSVEKTQEQINELYMQLDQLQANAFKAPDTGEIVLTGKEQTEFDKLNAKLDELEPKLDIDKQKANELGDALRNATGTATQSEIDKTKAKLSDAENKLQDLSAKAEIAGAKLQQSGKSGVAFSDGLSKGFEKVTNRISGLIKRIFFFSVITMGLRKLCTIFSDVAMSNEGFRQSLYQLQAALWTAFTPIINYIIPVVQRLINILTVAATAVGRFIAMLTGKSYGDMVNSAKALQNQSKAYKDIGASSGKAAKGMKKATDEAKKQLAAFDDLTIISEDKANADSGGASGGGGGAGGTGGGFDASMWNTLVTDIDAQLAALMGVAGGALLAIGLLLLFSGHIGWGIGFIIVGAAMFGVSLQTLTQKGLANPINEELMKIISIAGTSLVALGLILLFCGVWKWGVAFLVAGASALGVAIVATKSGKVDKEAEEMLINVMAIAGAAMLALGVILLCFGVVSGLSIGLVVAGAASLAGAIALNPRLVLQSVSDFLRDNAGLIVGISIALLVLGIILCVCGVITPLSIGLIVVGATGLVAEVVLNWTAIKTSISTFLKENQGLIVGVSLALLVLGIILCCTGVALPLGIGLIVVGAAGLATEVALNWDTIKEKVTTAFNKTIEWVKGWGLLVLGIILVVSGVGIPLGLALMKIGGANLTEAQDPLWTAIVDKVKEIWETIKTFWNTHIAKYFTAEWWGDLGKKMINGLIRKVVEGLNKLIEKINSFGFDLPDVLGGGHIGFNISKITPPQLAQGTVVPPNRKFLAMLGDNTKEHEIVSPLSTMKQAFTEAMIEMGGNFGGGNTEVVLEIDGREFGRAVVEQGNRENRRIGTRLVIV